MSLFVRPKAADRFLSFKLQGASFVKVVQQCSKFKLTCIQSVSNPCCENDTHERDVGGSDAILDLERSRSICKNAHVPALKSKSHAHLPSVRSLISRHRVLFIHESSKLWNPTRTRCLQTILSVKLPHPHHHHQCQYRHSILATYDIQGLQGRSGLYTSLLR